MSNVLRFILPCLALSVVTLAQAQPDPDSPEVRARLKQLDRFGYNLWFAIGMEHGTAGDPMLDVELVTSQLNESPDEHAQFVPGYFKTVREQGKVPFVLIEPNITPRFRRNLVPLMRIGSLGLFTDTETSEKYRQAMVEAIRHVASVQPGGVLKMGDVTMQLGDAQELIGILEQHDRERDQANAKLREANIAKLSTDRRHLNVIYNSLQTLQKAYGAPQTNMVTVDVSTPVAAVVMHFDVCRKLAREWTAQGKPTFIFGPANAPKSCLAGLVPIARVGTWGVWGTPEAAGINDRLVTAFRTTFQDEELKEKAYLMGIDDFGGPDELRQLVAGAPDVAVPEKPAQVAHAATAAPAKPSVVTTTPVVDRRGPPLPTGPAPSSFASSASAPPPRIAAGSSGPSSFAGDGFGCLVTPSALKAYQEEINRKEAARKAKLAQQEAARRVKNPAKDSLYERRLKAYREYQEQQRKRALELEAWNQRRLDDEAHRRQKQAQARDEQTARENAEIQAPGAVTLRIIDNNGAPRVEIRNNTSVWLDVEFDYGGTVGTESRNGSWHVWVADKTTTVTILPLFGDEDCRAHGYNVTPYNVHWSKLNSP